MPRGWRGADGGRKSGIAVPPRRFRLTLRFPVPGGVPAPCCLRLVPTSHKPSAPIPPTRARRALFPRWGRGSFQFTLPGASPPAPLHCAGSGTAYRIVCGTPKLTPEAAWVLVTFRGTGDDAPSATKRFLLPSGKGQPRRGGPGEMELSVADATAAFEMVPSPGAGRANNAGGKHSSGTGTPPGTRCSARRSAGMQGAKPLAKINLRSPPSPEGKGVGGMGAKVLREGWIKPETAGTSPLKDTRTAE